MSDPTHQTPENRDVAGRLGSGKIPRSPINPGVSGDVPIRSIGEDDGRALEALLSARASGADRGPAPAGLADRSARLGELLSLLDKDTVEDPPADLTARTLDAIRTHQQRKRFTEQVQMLSEPRRSVGIDWRQFTTAAAAFIIGACLLIPVMQRQQADSRRVAGASHMRMAGQAIATYAEDNLGQMPRGNVRPGVPWTEVGQPEGIAGPYIRSNSAHLYKLVREDYIDPQYLACPENPFAYSHLLTSSLYDWTSPEAVSFSYQNQYTPKMLRLEEAPTMAVLADRTPRFEVRDGRIVFNPDVPMDAPSRAHRGMGQNVLTADGAAAFRVRPTVDIVGNADSDNIWSVYGIDVYHGNEVQDDPYDSFLVP